MKKREGERENDSHGETKLLRWAGPKSFIFQKVLLYLALYIEGNERCKVVQSQPKHSSSFALIKTRMFFCKPFPQMMLCTLSSGLGDLWTFYDPLLIKAAQPENLFSLKVFFLYISNLCQPQKMPTRVTFHRIKVQWVTRKNQLVQRSDVVNFKATLVFLTFQLC